MDGMYSKDYIDIVFLYKYIKVWLLYKMLGTLYKTIVMWLYEVGPERKV